MPFVDNAREDFLLPKSFGHHVFVNVILFTDEESGFVVVDHFCRTVSSEVEFFKVSAFEALLGGREGRKVKGSFHDDVFGWEIAFGFVGFDEDL